jgi:hypothetical protein
MLKASLSSSNLARCPAHINLLNLIILIIVRWSYSIGLGFHGRRWYLNVYLSGLCRDLLFFLSLTFRLRLWPASDTDAGETSGRRRNSRPRPLSPKGKHLNMKLLIMKPSSLPILIPLCPNIGIGIPFSNIHSLNYSLKVRENGKSWLIQYFILLCEQVCIRLYFPKSWSRLPSCPGSNSTHGASCSRWWELSPWWWPLVWLSWEWVLVICWRCSESLKLKQSSNKCTPSITTSTSAPSRYSVRCTQRNLSHTSPNDLNNN